MALLKLRHQHNNHERNPLRSLRQKAGRGHFAVTKHVPYTNVWDFKPVQWYPGKHPCEKPLDLMRHIIEASSKPGDVVLDTFVGSGSTAIACKELGRGFVGCEMGGMSLGERWSGLRNKR